MLGLYRRSIGIEAVMMTASFNTHSFSMNQRAVVLKATIEVNRRDIVQEIQSSKHTHQPVESFKMIVIQVTTR